MARAYHVICPEHRAHGALRAASVQDTALARAGADAADVEALDLERPATV
jgi:hypothetical protein